MNIELNIKNRLLLSSILPKESDIKTMTICKDIDSKTSLTQEEFEEIGFTVKDGMYSWAKETVKVVDFTEAELAVIKEALSKLDNEKKITMELLGLYKKFN